MILFKINLQAGFYLNHLKERDEGKTVFHARYGLYSYVAMPFTLFNANAAREDAIEMITKMSWTEDFSLMRMTFSCNR
jgi:hypothetical protein